MKKRVKILCKAGVFVVILAVCLHFLAGAFRLKDEFTISPHFYDYEKNSFDVITLGTSLLMDGVYPMQMWDEYGIPSYCLGAGAESIPSAYFLAKEAIERHHPELIILECGSIIRNETIQSAEQLHHVTDTMPLWSLNRTKMILELADSERESLLLPFETYHMRWTELSETDFQEDYKDDTHGAVLTLCTNKSDIFERHEILTENALAEIPMEYLDKMVELCKNTDTQLLLVTMPVIGPSDDFTQEEFDQRRNAAYALEEFCDEKDIDYLNFIDGTELLGLDASTDSVEGKHLNMRGAEKCTSYLGNYIAENYDLPNRKGDSSYAFMEEDYQKYLETYQKKRILSSNHAEDFLGAICDTRFRDRYIVVLAEGSPAVALSSESADIIKQLGVVQDLSKLNSQAYLAVLDGGKNVYETPLSQGLTSDEQAFTVDEVNIKAYSNSENMNECRIEINGREYPVSKKGLHIVIYDKQNSEVIGTITASAKGIG